MPVHGRGKYPRPPAADGTSPLAVTPATGLSFPLWTSCAVATAGRAGSRCARSYRSRRGCMASLRSGAELACVHVLDHALTQRADRIRTHGKLLSWMRLKTPRSSRQSVSPATDDLSRGDSARDRARRAASYRASDLVL